MDLATVRTDAALRRREPSLRSAGGNRAEPDLRAGGSKRPTTRVKGVAMAAQPSRNEAQAKLWSMIKDIKVAMMTSWDGEEMHSRPMHGYQEEFEGRLYFFTKHASGKTGEIGRFDKLNLAYADIA